MTTDLEFRGWYCPHKHYWFGSSGLILHPP